MNAYRVVYRRNSLVSQKTLKSRHSYQGSTKSDESSLSHSKGRIGHKSDPFMLAKCLIDTGVEHKDFLRSTDGSESAQAHKESRRRLYEPKHLKKRSDSVIPANGTSIFSLK